MYLDKKNALCSTFRRQALFQMADSRAPSSAKRTVIRGYGTS